MHLQTQKQRLEQRKNKLELEEAKLKIKERKVRTRRLIEMGGLIVKANLDLLTTAELYGALLSLKEILELDSNSSAQIKQEWRTKGDIAFTDEKRLKTPVILKFTHQPNSDIRSMIRSYGLKWNRIRSEWYGEVTDLSGLKDALGNCEVGYEIGVVM